MTIASYIKEIGRGKEGARSLSEAQAQDLMSQVLDGAVTDLEIGAFALAMRIKGETVAELAGFLAATHARCLPLHTTQPTVVLPSYNGARKLPNLTPLLALLLAQAGVQVLVHGPLLDAGRISSGEVFQALALPLAATAGDVESAWARGEPAFISTTQLCAPLEKLLQVRRVVGLRNSGHTIAKVLLPCLGGSTLRVVNYTHPEYASMLSDFLSHTQGSAVLLRGTEGEPVADPRRAPRLQVFINGAAQPELSCAPQDGVLTELPELPRHIDAATTAAYSQSVISGAQPAPAPLVQQVQCLLQTLAAMEKCTPLEQNA
jgi:anthranilate phosphoribosyltransferase